MKRDYQTSIYELLRDLPNDLRHRVLGNYEIPGKSQNFTELFFSADSHSQNFVSNCKKLQKNRNGTLPVVLYFTLEMVFVLNIL